MTENHKVEEAEILTCLKCKKLTLHEIVLGSDGYVTDIRCVLCSIPKQKGIYNIKTMQY